MNGSDESPAVAELPDDVIGPLVEAASAIDIVPELLARIPEAVEYVDAWRKTLIDNGSLREESPTNDFLGVLTVAATWIANGSIAARVRAEALIQLCEALGEPIETPADRRMEPPYRMTWGRAIDIVRGRTTVWSDLLSRAQLADADWLNQYRGRAAGPTRASLTDRIAEAVADERQRIAADIRARAYDEGPFVGAVGPEASSLAGVRTFNAALEECASAVERGAAGSVPVATPDPAGRDGCPTCGVSAPQFQAFDDDDPCRDEFHSSAGPVATPTEPADQGAASSVPAVQPPTFEQLLTDPTEQFDKYSELLPAILRYLTQPGPADDAREALLRSVEEYRNAPPATASTSHLTRPAEPDEPRGVQGHAPGCEGWRPPQALGFGRSLPYLCVPGCPCAEQPEER